MLDALDLVSPRVVPIEEVCRELDGEFGSLQITADAYYQRICVFFSDERRRERLVSFGTSPRFQSSAPTKLKLNPSRFRSFRDLTVFIQRLVPEEGLGVTRTDHAVDLAFPVQDIYESLLYSRKKSRKDYDDGHTLTGFYFGKPPETLAVYDKAKQLRVPGTLTRIELRQTGKKVPVRYYNDLPALASYAPFQNLRFAQVTEDGDSVEKSDFLKAQIAKVGFQGTYKRLNRHWNFNRDFGGLIRDRTDIPSLDTIYRENVHAFFQR